MERSFTVTLDTDTTSDEFRDWAVDIASYLADQLEAESAEVTVHGRRGRGGWRTETFAVA